MGATIHIIQILLLVSLFKTKTAESANIALAGCPDNCGGVPIPYPFGIGPDCSLSQDFQVRCTATDNSISTPYVPEHFNFTRWENNNKSSSNKIYPSYNHDIAIHDINLSSGQARISIPISSQCYNSTAKYVDLIYWELNLKDSPYTFNREKNKFVTIGCDTLAYIKFSDDQNSPWGSCGSWCYTQEILTNGSCSGIGCCQTAIPKGTNYIWVEFDSAYNNADVYNFSRCSYAMLTEEAGFVFNTGYVTTNQLFGQNMTAVIDWGIGNTTCNTASTNKSSYACRSKHSVCRNSSNGPGYLCSCFEGYQGNPYLEGGCQDIDECANKNPCSKQGKCHNFQGGYRCSCHFGWRNKPNNICELNLQLITGICAGFVALLILGISLCVILERRNISKVKEQYFQQHGGWILLEKVKSDQGFGFTIFTSQQLERATNNFHSANIIGFGGNGTVYKGILRDHMVAIKKCKTVNESKKKEFGKEMLILSQINHKNIVKLLGCCLEVEVPILVYEYIPNGTLFHYIHSRVQGLCISLATRLKIAQESAEAFAYLHFSASPPIIHGDVKSANILLDQNYVAKVSDFGASILAPTDEAQIVTLVQGTCGYLDPEYMQTCQLTDKSDVYSFGVVLLELLTGKPAIDFNAPQKEMSLSSCFLCAVKENKIQELLDDDIKHQDDMEVIMEIVELAIKCLSMKGDERPTMKEVAEELGRIIKLKLHPWEQEYNLEEMESLIGEESHNMVNELSSYFSIDREAEESICFGR